MKSAWILLAVLCVAAVRVNRPTEWVKSAKITLGEALQKAVPEAKEGTPVTARLSDEKGRLLFLVDFAQGPSSLRVAIDAQSGQLVEKSSQSKDRMRIATGSKISMGGALESALAKVPGKAVRVSFALKKGKGIVEVKVVQEGKLYEVKLDGVTGSVIKVEPDDDEDDGDDDEDDDDD